MSSFFTVSCWCVVLNLPITHCKYRLDFLANCRLRIQRAQRNADFRGIYDSRLTAKRTAWKCATQGFPQALLLLLMVLSFNIRGLSTTR